MSETNTESKQFANLQTSGVRPQVVATKRQQAFERQDAFSLIALLGPKRL